MINHSKKLVGSKNYYAGSGTSPGAVAPSGQLAWTGLIPFCRRRVADEFGAQYGELLAGRYDCADRVVLNAHFSPGHNTGGFRTWWRRLHDGSDELLDDTESLPTPPAPPTPKLDRIMTAPPALLCSLTRSP